MKKFRVTAPNGRKYEVTADDDASPEQIQSYVEQQIKQGTREELKNPVTGMRGALEATANVATGAAAFPLQLGAGLAGAVLPGPPGQGQDYMNKVGDAFVYQPKTLAGQAIADTAHIPGEWLGNKAQQAGKAVADVAGAGAGAVTEATIETAPALLGIGGRAARPSVTKYIGERKQAYDARASRDSVKANTLEAGRAEGLDVPPSAFGGGSFLGNRVESIGGKAAVGQQKALENQQAFNNIARREAGLGENDPITEKTLDQARVPMEAPYREIAALSKTASKKLGLLKQARADAKNKWQQYGRSADPKDLAEAKKFDDKADRIEGLIDQEATTAGKPDLVKRLEVARIELAKNHAVEKALNLGDGNVDPRIWGRMLDKGAKLTGGLKTAAQFAEAFPSYARPESKIPTPGVSKSEALASVTLGVLGHAASGGVGTLAAGIPLLSHPARALALSRLMQPSTGLKPYSPGLGLRATLNATDQGITDPAALILMSEEKRKGLGL